MGWNHCSILIAGICWSVFARADIYLYETPQGVPHYSTTPLSASYERIIVSPKPAPHRDTNNVKIKQPRKYNQQKTYEPLITSMATQYGLSTDLVLSLVQIESGFNPQARSPKGAIGLMQVMPSTGAQYGVHNLHDPEQNLHAGMRYLRALLKHYENNVVLALAAYNAGQNSVAKHRGQIPPYQETMQYVPRVLARYQILQASNRTQALLPDNNDVLTQKHWN